MGFNISIIIILKELDFPIIPVLVVFIIFQDLELMKPLIKQHSSHLVCIGEVCSRDWEPVYFLMMLLSFFRFILLSWQALLILIKKRLQFHQKLRRQIVKFLECWEFWVFRISVILKDKIVPGLLKYFHSCHHDFRCHSWLFSRSPSYRLK